MMREREDGGPEDVRRYIRVCANRARKKLAPLGIEIRGEYSYGYRATDLWAVRACKQERARVA